MAIIKHSKRTLRDDKCPHCGGFVAYLGHDLDYPQGSTWTCNQSWCPENGKNYKIVYLDSAGQLHTCPDGTVASPPWSLEPRRERRSSSRSGSKAESSESRRDSGDNDEEDKALSVLRRLFGADTLKALIAEHLPDMVGGIVARMVPNIAVKVAELITPPPTRIEVKGPDGERRKVDGLTHKMFPKLLKLVGMGMHVYMPGPAGTGKTHMAGQVAEALGLEFFAMSVGPMMTEAKLLGYMDATGKYVPTIFHTWARNGGVFLLDEADSGASAVLNVINAALAQMRVTFPHGEVIKLEHGKHIVIAAGNTYGNGADALYNGRQALDGAFKNRFSFLYVPIDEDLERNICLSTGLPAARVDRALAYVRAIRAQVAELQMDVIVGPRNAERFCRILADGDFSREEAVEIALKIEIEDSDWSRLTAKAPALHTI